jgi:hypothetical protein
MDTGAGVGTTFHTVLPLLSLGGEDCLSESFSAAAEMLGNSSLVGADFVGTGTGATGGATAAGEANGTEAADAGCDFVFQTALGWPDDGCATGCTLNGKSPSSITSAADSFGGSLLYHAV